MPGSQSKRRLVRGRCEGVLPGSEVKKAGRAWLVRLSG